MTDPLGSLEWSGAQFLSIILIRDTEYSDNTFKVFYEVRVSSCVSLSDFFLILSLITLDCKSVI